MRWPEALYTSTSWRPSDSQEPNWENSMSNFPGYPLAFVFARRIHIGQIRNVKEWSWVNPVPWYCQRHDEEWPCSTFAKVIGAHFTPWLGSLYMALWRRLRVEGDWNIENNIQIRICKRQFEKHCGVSCSRYSELWTSYSLGLMYHGREYTLSLHLKVNLAFKSGIWKMLTISAIHGGPTTERRAVKQDRTCNILWDTLWLYRYHSFWTIFRLQSSTLSH